jgi:hypothetical protein
MDLIFKGEIKENKLRIFEQSRLTNLISTLNNQKVELILRKDNKKRTLNANAYYWGVIIKLLSNYTGYESEEMHEILKYKFLGYEIVDFRGEKIVKINSTKNLDKDKFQEYVQKCVRWGNSLGVEFPSPDEIY